MSQLPQQKDGPSELHLFPTPQDSSPTVGRGQVQYSPSNPSPKAESGRRYADAVHTDPLQHPLTQITFLGLSARQLLVLYKPPLLLLLLSILRQEQPFQEVEVLPIKHIHRRAPHIKVYRKDHARPRSAWTTYWPRRRAFTQGKTTPPIQSRK